MTERVQTIYERTVLRINSAIQKVERLTGFTNIKSLIRDMGKLLVSNRLAGVFYTIIGIIIIRALGPVKYGELGLVTNLSGFLIIPMMAGANNSMVMLLPGSDGERSNQLIGTVMFGNLLITAMFGGLFFALQPLALRYLHMASGIWMVGVAFSVILAFSTITEYVLRGQKNFKTIARLKFVNCVLYCGLVFLLLRCFPQAGYREIYLCSGVAGLISILWAVRSSRFRMADYRFSWPTVKEVYHYGVIMMVNVLLMTILTSSDLLLVNYFHPGREVGIYSAYQGYVKNLFTGLFFDIFAAVFLPTIAEMDKISLYQKLNRYIYWLAPLVILLTGGLTAIAALFFGKEFPFNLTYILLVSASIGVYFVFQIYYSIFSMKGNEDAKLCTLSLGITVPISLLLIFLGAKYWGITGAMIGVLVTNVVLVLVFKALIFRRYKLT